MKKKLLVTTSLVFTAFANQAHALGVTELLHTTGESLAHSVKSTAKSEMTKSSTKSTKDTNSKSVTRSTKESAAGSSESTKDSGKTSAKSTTEGSEKTTKNSPESSSKAVKSTARSTGETTEWLICKNKCKILLDEPALVPAAKQYLQNEPISLIAAEKLIKFVNAAKEENPEYAKHPDFENTVLLSLVSGDLD